MSQREQGSKVIVEHPGAFTLSVLTIKVVMSCASIPGNHGGSSKKGGMEQFRPLSRCAGPPDAGDIPLGSLAMAFKTIKQTWGVARFPSKGITLVHTV